MKIYIASDHGGFDLKTELIEKLALMPEYPTIDLGPSELNPDDNYPEFAFKVADQVIAEEGSIGILICRSGNGMAIAANKVKGIRAALCFTEDHAKKAREHNHANVLVLDAEYSSSDPMTIIRAFLVASPLSGRHEDRVKQIVAYEAK